MTGNGRPLVPYLRQSRAKERTISIEEQRRDIRQWADAAGVELAAEIVEQNVSGSKPWRERALGEAVDACERGEASGIIVAWQDRLSRENGRATAEVWEALEQLGARLVCAAESLDTAAGDHEMLFTIKAAIAREQWKRHRANWEGTRRNSIAGGVPAGRAPFGYRKRKGSTLELHLRRLEVHARAAAKVLEAFELRARGVPFSAIARRFGWSQSTTRQILCNRVYLGELRHGGFVNEHAHAAIVPADLFDAVQASRTSRPVAPGSTTASCLLLGLARCSGCGRTLKVVRRPRADGSHVAAYYCKDAASEPCPDRAYVHVDRLDDFVADWFTQAIADVPRMVDVVAQARDLEDAQRKHREAEAQLTAYVENASALDASLFQRGVDARQKRVDEARRVVQELSGRVTRLPSGGSLIDLWESFAVDERREVLGGFLDRIEVRRGASSELAASVRLFWVDGTEVTNEEARVRVAAA